MVIHVGQNLKKFVEIYVKLNVTFGVRFLGGMQMNLAGSCFADGPIAFTSYDSAPRTTRPLTKGNSIAFLLIARCYVPSKPAIATRAFVQPCCPHQASLQKCKAHVACVSSYLLENFGTTICAFRPSLRPASRRVRCFWRRKFGARRRQTGTEHQPRLPFRNDAGRSGFVHGDEPHFISGKNFVSTSIDHMPSPHRCQVF